MIRKLALAAFATAFASTAFTLSSAEAARSTCKKVYLSAQNSTGGKVKVIDLDYYIRGYGKKSEPIRNQEIPNGRNWATERNLEQASGRSLYVAVKYRKLITERKKVWGKWKTKTKWSKVITASSNANDCFDGQSYTVTMR